MALADAQVRMAAQAILREALDMVSGMEIPFEYTMDEARGGAAAFLKTGIYGEDPIPTSSTQKLYAIAYVLVAERETFWRQRRTALHPLLGE